MHIILTGATGLVGLSILEAALQSPSITKISILSRRPVPYLQDKYPTADPNRVKVLIHSDYATYPPALLDQLSGASACVWAQGTSQTQVGSEEEYVKITKEWPLAAAKAFSTLSQKSSAAATAEAEDGKGEGGKFRFVYISGEGATHTPGRFTQLFARVKGSAEVALSELPDIQVDSLRPCAVDDGDNAPVRGYAPKTSFPISAMRTVLMPVVKNAFKDYHSPTRELGDFCVRLARGQVDGELEGLKGRGAERLGSGWLVDNQGFRRVMGLKKG